MYAEEALTKYQRKFGGVAQLGEHLPCKQGVRSSILLISTNSRHFANLSRFCSGLCTDVHGAVAETVLNPQTDANFVGHPIYEKYPDSQTDANYTENFILIVP